MSANRINKIAIVGATGHLASHVVAELLKIGRHTITALSRQDSKATFPDGVEVARVDYSSEESLVSALRDHDFLMITLTSRVPPELHPNIVKAAVKAGVPWIMPNVYGYDILNDRLNNEYVYGPATKKGIADVTDCKADFIALCCGFWFEWSISAGEQFYGFDIKNRKVIFFDDGKTRINTSTLTQCGKAMAALLSLPVTKEDPNKPALEDWKNKPFYVSSFLISQRDMLDSLERVTSTVDQDWTIEYQTSEERVRSGMDDMKKGDFGGFARAMYTRVFYPNGDGDFESVRGLSNGILGLEKEDVDKAVEWVVNKTEAGEMVYDRHG